MPKRARAKSIKISKKIEQNPEKRKKIRVDPGRHFPVPYLDMFWCKDCALYCGQYLDSLPPGGDRKGHVPDEDDASKPQKRAKAAHGLVK
jgi:hypothetical protein